MNKAELVDVMAKEAGLTKKDAEAALNALTDTVEGAVKRKEKVVLVGFGTWEVRQRAPRKGMNPKTKQEIKIPGKLVPAFKAGKAFRDEVK